MKTIHTHSTKTLFGAFTLASLLAILSSEQAHAAGVILLDDFATDTTVTIDCQGFGMIPITATKVC